MRNCYCFLLWVCLLLFPWLGWGQQGKAKRLLRAERYREAVAFLDGILSDTASESASAKLYYYAGQAHLQGFDYAKGLAYLQRAEAMDPKVGGKTRLYWLAVGYFYNQQYGLAMQAFEEYEGRVSKRMAQYMHIELWKKSVDLASRLPVPNTVSGYRAKLAEALSTEFMEHSPAMSVDGNTLYFTSRRGNTTGGRRAPDGEYMEDVLVAKRLPSGEWAEPSGLEVVNTKQHDATVYLYDADRKLVVYRSKRQGDFYLCEAEGDGWSAPKPFPRPINSNHYEAHAYITDDGSTMIFSSTRKRGDLDLYMSTFDGSRWSKPERLPDHINTLDEEDAPFLSADRQTLYFASTGHNSMGGYDLFKCKWDPSSNTWGAPVRLEGIFNSPQDDIFLIWDAKGEKGLFASDRAGGKGQLDLYEISNLYHLQLEGVVANKATGAPLPNLKLVFIAQQGQQRYEAMTDASGNYSLTLPSGAGYKLNLLRTSLDQPELGLFTDTVLLAEALEPDVVAVRNFQVEVSAEAEEAVADTGGTPVSTLFEGHVVPYEGTAVQVGTLQLRSLQTGKILGEIPVGAQGKFSKSLEVGPRAFVAFDFLRSDGVFFPNLYTVQPARMNMPVLTLTVDEAFSPKLSANEVAQQLDLGKSVRVKSLVFDYGSAQLSDYMKRQLDEIIRFSEQFSDAKVRITGHNFGFDLMAQDVSQQRVLHIIQYLETKGVPRESISYGYNDQDEKFRDRAPQHLDDVSNAYIRRVDVRIAPTP